MELPAVRPPRRSWRHNSKRFFRRLFSPSQADSACCTACIRKTKAHSYPYQRPPSMESRYDMRASDPSPPPPPFFSSTKPSQSQSPANCPLSSSSRRRAPLSRSGQQQQSHGLFGLLSHHRRVDSKDHARKLSLPHTITERHGGRNLWVTAPVLTDELEKQGFRWRKKWKTRFVELNGRVLSYFETTDSPLSPTTSSDGERPRRTDKPRKSVMLTADALLVDMDALTFSVTPAPEERPWIFRARDTKTKAKWCRALHDCIDILIWLQHYELGDVLGVGGNGVVRTLVDRRNGRRYAVKIVDASKFKNRAAVVSEVEILRNITNDIRHPNLVKIHKVYEEQEKIYMILDLCEGGELYDSIVQRGCYSERDAAKIMQQLLSALQALHRHNILHLDIKPENILLSSRDPSDAKIVLTDFGLARMVHGRENPLDNTGKTTMAGTIGYIAPEVIASHMYTEAADVFSAGVILFILLVGYPPFFGDSEVEILLKIARGDFQFHAEDWAHISPSAKELVARMLEVRAQDRITVEEALQHPWIVENGGDSDLTQTVRRMQEFNFLRKSENMASCMATMLVDDNEADFHALADERAVDSLIRQLTPSGSDRMVVDRALVLAKALGLSPFVDAQDFVKFLDRNGDGFIDAQDFCNGIQAMRDGHEEFATIIFAALQRMGDDPAAPNLSRAHFETAFEKLGCPEPLRAVFFKYLDEHPIEAIGETDFTTLLQHFRFLGMLFMLRAKNNVMVIARTGSIDELPQIVEEIRESISSGCS
ncbi:hypothetical protein ATCC90586_002576 [Pythium insidiosum]|nr:hypothetical protein ATCC90586_002576 [Pythium insidiosum]